MRQRVPGQPAIPIYEEAEEEEEAYEAEDEEATEGSDKEGAEAVDGNASAETLVGSEA